MHVLPIPQKGRLYIRAAGLPSGELLMGSIRLARFCSKNEHIVLTICHFRSMGISVKTR